MSAFTISAEQQRFVAANVGPSTDRDGRPQVDPRGTPLWEVRVMALPDAEPGSDRVPMPEIIRVAIPAQTPPPLAFGQPVAFEGLMVRTWSARDGRAGLRYSADSVLPIQPQPQAQAKATPSASSAEPAR